jgi:hypothetical protein
MVIANEYPGKTQDLVPGINAFHDRLLGVGHGIISSDFDPSLMMLYVRRMQTRLKDIRSDMQASFDVVRLG